MYITHLMPGMISVQLYSCYSANNRAIQSSVTDCFVFPVVPVSNEYEIIKFLYLKRR
jgi:hypothetical protein